MGNVKEIKKLLFLSAWINLLSAKENCGSQENSEELDEIFGLEDMPEEFDLAKELAKLNIQKIEIQNLKSQLEDMKEIVKAYNESKLTKQLEQYKSKYGELK